MKTLGALAAIIIALGAAKPLSGQPPIYGFTTGYEIVIAPDTLRQHFLLRVNQDSVDDLVLATLDGIWAYDGTNGLALIDPIPIHRRGFAFMPYAGGDSALNVLLAYRDGYVPGDSNAFKIIHFHFSAPEERDSISVTASIPMNDFPTFDGVTYIQPFDIGNDGAGEYFLFYSYSYLIPTIGTSQEGFFIAVSAVGRLIADTRPIDRVIKMTPFRLGFSPMLSLMSYSNFSSVHGYDVYRQSLKALDDSIRIVNTDSVSGGSFRQLKNESDNVVRTLQYAVNFVGLYDGPFLDNGLTHSFPCNAMSVFYNIEDSLFILTGCPNSYFELRDLEWHLEAFVWGPNITISDAEAIDIDRDGTDELLCRSATGFVLYRLDTTAVDVAHDEGLLPKSRALSAYPNPFNAAVTISLSGFDNAPEIAIYDIAGRLVRRLPSQTGRTVWDGRAADGAEAQSGAYFVRAEAMGQSAATRIILLK